MPHDLLEAVSGLSSEDLRRPLDRLRRAESLYDSRLFPLVEYAFTHALTHEVAYGTLLHERRRALHARILEEMEANEAKGTDRIERLAEHAFKAEVWDRAIEYLRRAAHNAVARSADTVAAACLEQAVAALAHLPRSRDMLERAVDLRLQLRNILMPLADRGRIIHCLTEAEALAKELGDQRRLGWISGYMAPYLWGIGDYARAFDAGQRALHIAVELRDPALSVIANRYLGHAYHAVGDYRRAARLLRRSVNSLEDDIVRAHSGSRS